MKDQRKQPSHFVQVARLRIETTIIVSIGVEL